jgi:hypothetical protein
MPDGVFYVKRCRDDVSYFTIRDAVMVSSILRDAVRVSSMLRDAVTVSHPKIYCTVFLGVAFMMPGWQVSSFLAGEPKTSVSPMTGHSWSMLRCEGIPMFGITSDSGVTLC